MLQNINNNQNTTIDFSELTVKELDAWIESNLPQIADLVSNSNKSQKIGMIELFNAQLQATQQLADQLATVSKKTRSSKTKKSDQNFSKLLNLLKSKLDNCIEIDTKNFDGSSVKILQFLIDKEDVKHGFSINQLTRFALTDFAKSYASLGSHFLKLGFVQTVKPYGLYTKYDPKDKENEEYNSNQYCITIQFFDNKEEYEKMAFYKKNGKRNSIKDDFFASDDILELIKNNFDKSPKEILSLAINSFTK